MFLSIIVSCVLLQYNIVKQAEIIVVKIIVGSLDFEKKRKKKR